MDTGSVGREVFHEKQTLGHCAVHCLNNLMQERWISFEELQNIAQILHNNDKNSGISGTFSWNPYMSAIPFAGYFDINCIVKALEGKNCRISEHVLTIERISEVLDTFINPCTLKGILVNEEISSYIPFVSTRHWYTIIPIEAEFYNLDSKLDAICKFPALQDMKTFLEISIKNRKGQFFIIS